MKVAVGFPVLYRPRAGQAKPWAPTIAGVVVRLYGDIADIWLLNSDGEGALITQVAPVEACGEDRIATGHFYMPSPIVIELMDLREAVEELRGAVSVLSTPRPRPVKQGEASPTLPPPIMEPPPESSGEPQAPTPEMLGFPAKHGERDLPPEDELPPQEAAHG